MRLGPVNPNDVSGRRPSQFFYDGALLGWFASSPSELDPRRLIKSFRWLETIYAYVSTFND